MSRIHTLLVLLLFSFVVSRLAALGSGISGDHFANFADRFAIFVVTLALFGAVCCNQTTHRASASGMGSVFR